VEGPVGKEYMHGLLEEEEESFSSWLASL